MSFPRPPLATPASTTAPHTASISQAISTHLTALHLPPTAHWLTTFLPSIRASTPLVAIKKTALFRILATDITASLNVSSSDSLLPARIVDATVQETKLTGPVVVQVLDIEDIGRSRWSQVEALEAIERGETTKGREIIRVVPDANAPDVGIVEAKSAGPHKLLLQDAAGTKVYAMELTPIHGVSVQMAIGIKLVLSDVVVARGVLLLEPRGVEVLGGKVETWEKKWREERKGRLKVLAGWREDGT